MVEEDDEVPSVSKVPSMGRASPPGMAPMVSSLLLLRAATSATLEPACFLAVPEGKIWYWASKTRALPSQPSNSAVTVAFPPCTESLETAWPHACTISALDFTKVQPEYHENSCFIGSVTVTLPKREELHVTRAGSHEMPPSDVEASMAITKTDTRVEIMATTRNTVLEWDLGRMGFFPCSSISWLALRAPSRPFWVSTYLSTPSAKRKSLVVPPRNCMVWVCASMHVVYVTKTAMKYMKQ